MRENEDALPGTAETQGDHLGRESLTGICSLLQPAKDIDRLNLNFRSSLPFNPSTLSRRSAVTA